MIHEVRQNDEPQLMKQDQQDRSFDSEKIKCLNFDNVNSVICTKLESSTSQRGVWIAYKIDSGVNGNLMPFKNFKTLFLKSTTEALHATKNNTIVLKHILILIVNSQKCAQKDSGTKIKSLDVDSL